MEKYEYYTLTCDTGGFFGGKLNVEAFQATLNRLGNDGWELVSTFATAQLHGSSKTVVCIFKRSRV